MTRKKLIGTAAAVALGLSAAALAQPDPEKVPAPAKGEKAPPVKAEPKKTEAKPVEAKPAPAAKVEIPSIKIASLDTMQITNLQTKLKDAGLYTGDIDGKVGRLTRAALTAWFQHQAAMVANGRLSEAALSSFGFSSSEIERVRGVDRQGTTERAPTGGAEKGGAKPGPKY